MKKVTIFTDGGCVGNPGPGAWACLLEYGKYRKEMVGGEPATTNNRMEITAAIRALEALKEPCVVQLFTDSEYLRQGITEWIHSWKKRNWLTSTNQPVKNRDLWMPLDSLASRHRIDWRWLRGHAGHPGNEHCDTLAGKEIARIRAAFTPEQLREALRAFQAGGTTEAATTSPMGI